MNAMRASLLFLAASALLSGCGGVGSKLLREPIPDQHIGPLANAADGRVQVTLEQIVVQDGPGTWSENAFWDEYRFAASSLADDPVRVTGVEIVNSLGNEAASQADRASLVAMSKSASRDYKKAGIEVIPGAGANKIAETAAVAGGAGLALGAIGASAVPAMTFGVVSAGAVVVPVMAAGAVVVAAPFVAATSILKSIDNGEVDKALKARMTNLPVLLDSSEPVKLVAFFPIAPSPTEIRVHYASGAEDFTLSLPVAEVLSGLHLPTIDEE